MAILPVRFKVTEVTGGGASGMLDVVAAKDEEGNDPSLDHAMVHLRIRGADAVIGEGQILHLSVAEVPVPKGRRR